MEHRYLVLVEDDANLRVHERTAESLADVTFVRADRTYLHVVIGSGPDHARAYVAEVFVAGNRLGVGEGRSKKDAEQEAARNAWEGLTNA